jgi:pimeloyl-ACP methyl ester carboxylesterase
MATKNADSYTRSWSPDGDIANFALSDSTHLRYLKTGRGPALVLLHTLRTQLDYYQRLIPLLAEDFTVYAVDFPGLGWSDIKPGASYEEPALREAVVEFIDALNLEDVTLVGESIGATVALTASTELGSRVEQVIALNTYDYPQGVERANLLASIVVKGMRIPVMGLMFSKLANPAILGEIMGGGFYDPKTLPKDFVLEQLRSAKRPGYASVETKYFRALPSYIAARDLYPKVTASVTLVYGDHDWSKPEERRDVARLIEGSRMISLRQAGHFSALEHPEAIARIVLDATASPNQAVRLQRKVAGGAS